MKKSFAIASLTLLVCATARAVDMALVYESSAAVTAGRSWPTLIVDGGAAVPATGALGALNTLLYGDGDGLYRGQIARLDNDINLAIVRRGERVGDAALQTAHASRWQASVAFLNITTVPASGAPGINVTTVAPTPGSEPFGIKIEGQEPGEQPIALKRRLNKTRFTLNVVNTSTSPVWSIQVRLTSDPQLSFWKEGRRGGLNDVPEKVFSYTHQSVFNPIKPGAGFKVPVEVYFIKERDYIWHLTLVSKNVTYERKILVRIE